MNNASATYTMIPHVHPWRFQNENLNIGGAIRMTTKEKLMMTKSDRAKWDGLTNIQYRLDGFIR